MVNLRNPLSGLTSNITGKTSTSLFEIRLEKDVIVLRGDPNEATSQLVRGVVVLCLPSSLKVEHVHLRMSGHLRIAWTISKDLPGVHDDKTERTKEIYRHNCEPFIGQSSSAGPGSSSKSITLPAGNYEWPFEIIIPGTQAESVEGLGNSFLKYKLKATVARGKLAYDLHAWKAIRIVRTLDPSALELSHAMTVENVWPNKMEYRIEIPSKAVPFGTWIDVDMRFTSLLKGLKIGGVKCVLFEFQKDTLSGQTRISRDRTHETERKIEEYNFELGENEYQDMIDENGADGWVLKEKLPLPKSLNRCVQSCEVRATPYDNTDGFDGGGIEVKHKVRFYISLVNPDGHISELRAVLPVHLFISPHIGINENGTLVDQSPAATQAPVQHAPPNYGEHVLDQLYADMDTSGIMTPAVQSGMNTPFYSHSRGGSVDNLATENNHSPSGAQNGAPSPDALSNRLQDLHMSSRTTISRNNSFRRLPENHSGGNTPHHHSGNQSTAQSRRASEEDDTRLASGPSTPEHIDYADFTKVPSYQTAVKTPVPRTNPLDARLPDYETAISAPPSPAREFVSPARNGAVNGNVNGYGNGSGSGSGSGTPPGGEGLASVGFTAVQSASAAHGR